MANSKVPTPHIQALEGEIAETILLPGDPLRAKFIADNFLTEVKQFIGIYSYELIHFYGCKNLIRVGTAGALNPKCKVRDMVFGMGACTTSNYVRLFGLQGDYSCIASYELLSKAVESAKALGLEYHVGNILSSDMFYAPDKKVEGGMTWTDMGVLAVEMEAAALYSNAAAAGANALCIVTISDSEVTGEVTTAQERQTTFTNMMKVALSLA